MAVKGSQIGVGCGGSDGCVDEFGCVDGQCPDFTIRRHDTKPPFKVDIEDCDGPMDLTDLVLEINMWAKGKIKTAIDETDTYFALADAIGFQQIMVGDTIIMDRIRLTERMLVTGFDESKRLVQVQRGYNGTEPQEWKKGHALRIMRSINSPAQTEMVLDDVIQTDGKTLPNQITQSFLIYEWLPNDTCLPGCYWLEFKLLKMLDDIVVPAANFVSALQTTPSMTPPSFTDPSLTPDDFGCILGEGVEWVRRYPVNAEGFLIKVTNSPTMEL